MISLIVAYDENQGIGYEGWMPWDVKEDLALFKKITLNHKIIMGRTTYEGLKKPLKNRYTYVVSKHQHVVIDPTYGEIINDLLSLLEEYRDVEEEVIVCGGAQIYEQALPFVSKIYLSQIKGVHKADTFFPSFQKDQYSIEVEKQFDQFVFFELRKSNSL